MVADGADKLADGVTFAWTLPP